MRLNEVQLNVKSQGSSFWGSPTLRICLSQNAITEITGNRARQ